MAGIRVYQVLCDCGVALLLWLSCWYDAIVMRLRNAIAPRACDDDDHCVV